MDTAYTHRIVIVVPAARQAEANALAKQIDPVGGERTFTVGLSATGNAPATHYWAATSATENGRTQIEAAKAVSASRGWLARVFVGVDPEEVLSRMGLRRIVGARAK